MRWLVCVQIPRGRCGLRDDGGGRLADALPEHQLHLIAQFIVRREQRVGTSGEVRMLRR